MSVETKLKIATGLNLTAVLLIISSISLIARADYLNIQIAVLLIGFLITSSFLMLFFYKKEKLVLGSLFFTLNLLGLIVLPIIRIIGTSYREGYIEFITITIPLIILIYWNKNLLKSKLGA